MSRLVWTETRDGWQSGRYLIELAAPQLWVLSRRPKRGDDAPMDYWEVVRTAGSLRQLKSVASEMERHRNRRRGLLIHVAAMLFLAVVAIAAYLLDWVLVVPAVAGVFALFLRTLVIWIEAATGNAWSVISEHYQ
ncbi:MAG TPA: hypothetical protein VLA91_09440 [Acidimicrobiia bacterium]|nr:hypothetical protein [Acidimicrobiia bacterium]